MQIRVLFLGLSTTVVACQSHKLDAAAIDALRARADTAIEAGRWDDCARLYGQLAATKVDEFGDRYNAACCLARGGHADRAFAEREQVTEGRDGSSSISRATPTSQSCTPIVDGQPCSIWLARTAIGGKIDWAELAKGDADRRAHVRHILTNAGARVADDYYHAAMIFQHGATPEDFRTSHDLALKAVALAPGHSRARWLAAASKDRELVALGKPQLYGTQFRTDAKGTSTRYPVDPSITNAERARWEVPPIPESK